MKTTNTLLATAAVLAMLLLGACSSTPTWEGMSQSQIAQWKGMGFSAGAAQAWAREGFSPETAGSWKNNGFDLEAATDWKAEQFTAEEAMSWRKSGFDLDEAVEDRAKGLQPVAPDVSTGN
jgi:hypothetical protein